LYSKWCILTIFHFFLIENRRGISVGSLSGNVRFVRIGASDTFTIHNRSCFFLKKNVPQAMILAYIYVQFWKKIDTRENLPMSLVFHLKSETQARIFTFHYVSFWKKMDTSEDLPMSLVFHLKNETQARMFTYLYVSFWKCDTSENLPMSPVSHLKKWDISEDNLLMSLVFHWENEAQARILTDLYVSFCKKIQHKRGSLDSSVSHIQNLRHKRGSFHVSRVSLEK